MGGVVIFCMGDVIGSPSPLALFTCRLWSLAGGVDVQLTLQDVVDDGLTQVVHNMAVTVLQGQSEGAGGQ